MARRNAICGDGSKYGLPLKIDVPYKTQPFQIKFNENKLYIKVEKIKEIHNFVV
jgi:hypothetical protein